MTSDSEDSQSGVKVFSAPQSDERVDLAFVVESLAQHDINDLLVEAGPTLSGAMLQAGLVDELIVYMAPTLLGDKGKGLLSLPGLKNIEQQMPLKIEDMRMVGPDVRITAKVN